MKIKYIGTALIFLIDFNINNIDILPDFIAVLLILKALGKTCFINENLMEARSLLKILFAVSFIKFTAGMIYFFVLRGSYSDYYSMIMTMVFIFSLSEFILSALIFKKILKGLELFSFMSGSFRYFKNAQTCINILYIFFIAKFVLTFAVQSPFLLSDSDLEALSIPFNVFLTADLLNSLLTPPCVVIHTFLGIFMLSVALPFFSGISKDAVLNEFITDKITVILTEDFFFKLRLNLKSAFAFFSAGCIFFIDLRLEQIIILPDFIICPLFILGIMRITGSDKDMINKKLNVYLIINFFVSLGSYILNSVYSVRVFHAFADELQDLYNLRLFGAVFYHISVILFFLIFTEMYYFIKTLQYKHMEFSAGYLKKYFTADEKALYKNKNLILRGAAAVFCMKTLAAVLPGNNGLLMFLYVSALVAFVVWAIKSLVSARDDIYNYYG